MIRILRFHQVAVRQSRFVPVMAVRNHHLFRFHQRRNPVDRRTVGHLPQLIPHLLKFHIDDRIGGMHGIQQAIDLFFRVGIKCEDLAEIRFCRFEQFKSVLFCFGQCFLMREHDLFFEFFQPAERDKSFSPHFVPVRSLKRLHQWIDGRFQIPQQNIFRLPLIVRRCSCGISVFLPAENKPDHIERIFVVITVLLGRRDNIVRRRNNICHRTFHLIVADSFKWTDRCHGGSSLLFHDHCESALYPNRSSHCLSSRQSFLTFTCNSR